MGNRECQPKFEVLITITTIKLMDSQRLVVMLDLINFAGFVEGSFIYASTLIFLVGDIPRLNDYHLQVINDDVS